MAFRHAWIDIIIARMLGDVIFHAEREKDF